MNLEPLVVVSLDSKRSEGLAPLTTSAADRGAARHLIFERLREAAASTPGVKSAVLSRIAPLGGGGWNTMVTLPDSESGRPGVRLPWMNAVTPGWFRTYGIRVVAGRDFTSDDRAGSPLVSVVNQAFVRRFFNGENPIGKRVSRGIPGGEQIETEVVGVVSDSAYRSVRDGLPATMFVALRQIPADPALTLTVEAASTVTGDLQRQIGQRLTSVDAGFAFTMQPFSERVRSTIAQEKLVAILSGFFGGLALLLACVGLYGVTAYGVSRRRSEIGVRMALGAEPGRVVRLVLGRVVWLVLTGVAIGAGVSYWAAAYVGPAVLFGLQPRDTRTFVTAAGVLIAVGMITAWLPARRASRIDPTQVLRES
jgi:predicted permease